MLGPSADRVYDLAFVYKGERGQPELIIRIHPPYITKFEEHVTRSIPTDAFKRTGVAFDQAEDAFGYGGCAYRICHGDLREYHFPLIYGQRENIARTFSRVLAVATALASKSEADNARAKREPNRAQALTLFAERTPLGGLHAYPLYGWVSAPLRRWLARYAQNESKAYPWSGTKPLPESIRIAMRTAWEALARPGWVEWADEVRAGVTEDGRFSLGCFGNACDIAIYPDLDFGPEFDGVSHFSCHNLDTAEQQLTLLVGLTALYELVLKDID